MGFCIGALARVDSSIRSVKELENKTLATSRPKSADHGLHYRDFRTIRTGPEAGDLPRSGRTGRALAAVQSGRVAGSVFNRYYTLRLKKDGYRAIEKLERPDYFSPSALFVRKDSLQNKRKALQSFLVAMMEATERQKRDKELCLRLIRKNLRLNDPEVVEAAYQDG